MQNQPYQGIPTQDEAAWKIIEEFAEGSGNATMPETEAKLKMQLGEAYRLEDWKPAFDAVFNAEDDNVAAVTAVRALASAARQPSETINASLPVQGAEPGPLPQLVEYETDLMSAVNELFNRRRIRGECPTLDDLLNSVEEREVGDSPYKFPGGDKDIVARVREELAANECRMDNEDAEDSDEETELNLPSAKEGISLCEQLEKLCIAHSDAHGVSALLLQTQLRRLRRHLHALDLASHKQVTLDTLWRNK